MPYPFFDVTDPSTWLAQSQPAQRQPLNLPIMTPAEQESTLSKLGGKVMGGLGYVGSSLDKALGGRAVRGLLGGKPEEALSLIPFSDALGITDEANRVGGKELLGLHGDDWGSTLGGMGAEIALDPATYLSFGAGALTKGGKLAKSVAKEAGVLPKTFSGQLGTTLANLEKAHAAAGPSPIHAALQRAGTSLDKVGSERLGAVAGLGLPFMDPIAQLSGSAGQGAMRGLAGAGAGIDTVLSAVPLVSGVWRGAKTAADAAGRYAGALFHEPNMGFTSHAGQEGGQLATARRTQRLAEHEDALLGHGQALRAAGHREGGADIRAMVENTFVGPMKPEVQSVIDALNATNEAHLARADYLGVDMGRLQDPHAGFLHREMAPLAKPTPGFEKTPNYGKGSRPLATGDPRISGREELVKDIPGGTVYGVNPMTTDPYISGPARGALSDVAAADYIRSKTLGWDAAKELEHEVLMKTAATNKLSAVEAEAMRTLAAKAQTGVPLTAQEAAELGAFKTRQDAMERLAELNVGHKKSMDLADMMHGMDPQRAASGGELPLFGQHPLQDQRSYNEHVIRVQANAEAARALLMKQAEAIPVGAGAAQGFKTLDQAMHDVGLASGQGKLTLAQELAGMGKGQGSLADLHGMVVPESTINEITRSMAGFQMPDALRVPLEKFDWFTRLNKAWQTSPWLSFHTRNLAGGTVQNLSSAGPGAVGDIGSGGKLYAGRNITRANTIPGRTHLTEEEATKSIGRAMAAHNVGTHNTLARDTMGRPLGATTLDEFMSAIPGEKPVTIGSSLAKLFQPGWWNVFDVENHPLIQAGTSMGNVVEGTNRGSMFIALKRQGYSDAEAARRTLEAHFNYSSRAQTGFEREVMQRLVPFYKFARGNIPLQAQSLMQHPGGLEAMTARAAHDMRQQEGFLPDYLGQGLAVPMGQEEGGTKRYLTKTDLPIEQATELLRGGPHALQNTMMSIAGQSNPLIKAPLEYMTGKQFYTGRELPDLYSMTGSPLLDNAIMNLPTSRFATTARTLTDPRKWADPYAIPLNLGTGLKVSDIDMAKQRSISGREAVQEFLRGQPEIGKFQQIYVKPGNEGLLTPEEIELLRLNKTLEQQAIQQSRMRR